MANRQVQELRMEQILQEWINAMSTSSLRILGVRDICVCVLACTHCYQCWLSWGRGHHLHHPQWRPPPTLPSGSLPQCVASGWVKCVQRQSPGTQWESHPPSHHSSPARTKRTWMTHSCKCAVHVLLLHFCKFCVSAYSIPRGYRIHVWVTNSPLIPSHVQQ